MQDNHDLRLTRLEEVNTPVVLVIMDGIGIGAHDESDGVFRAYTPVLDRLMDEPLTARLQAHGTAVGLPTDDDMGNSEVGHNALGAGRVFSQGAKLVNESIQSGEIFNGDAWQAILKKITTGGALHFIGLVSDGNVHSHLKHLYRLVDAAVSGGAKKIRIHALLDGRDVGPKSALTYIEPLERYCHELRERGCDCQIGSGGGRMVTTMDRYEADWSIVERGWRTHVLGEGRTFASASAAIETYYKEDESSTDQYLDPFVVADDNGPVGVIHDGDAVICFNFRGDRAIELSRAFEEDDFDKFDRKRRPEVFYAGMMEYDGDAKIPSHYLVEPPAIDHTLSDYLCANKIRSFAISETQKFGHVTYFWNGNKSGYVDKSLETYMEIGSDKIVFDLRPWMKAAEITDHAVSAIASGNYNFVRLNYANGDMVGHTGNIPAIFIAVETVDICLGRLLHAVKKAGGIAIITADHGNADCMFTEKNSVRTPMVAHTKNPVPFIIQDFSSRQGLKMSDVTNPGLANVAATITRLLGLAPPAQFAASLIRIDNAAQ
jgi:2,3-bisphosphoglycerate-independent phosphoglycerate mutase